jgi:hypothetical protein
MMNTANTPIFTHIIMMFTNIKVDLMDKVLDTAKVMINSCDS